MKVVVDPNKCLGCGVCEGDAPDVFELSGDVATVKMDPVPDKYKKDVETAIADCPEEAIAIVG
jgi:ferredoxin